MIDSEPNVAELRKSLMSKDIDVLYDALVDIGKGQVRDLESEVWKFLDHDDNGLRNQAVMTLGVRLAVPEFRDRALKMWKTDPDDSVRCSALASWAGYYQRSNDREVIAALNEVLRNESENVIVRTEALRGLFEVTGPPDRHVNFDAMYELGNESKFDKLVPWHEVDAMVGGWPPKRR
jgi:hypothetical protein